MSKHLFAFTLDSGLQQTIDTLLANHAAGQYADSSTSVKLAVGTTDAIIKALALDVIEILKSSGESAGVMDMLAKLLKSTMGGLIKGIMGTLDKGEQDKLAAYLGRRRLAVSGNTRFGFPMPEAIGARFEAVIGQITSGQITPATRPELTQLMNQFVDLCMSNFYDEFTGSLDLGFVKRKLVDVGRGTITKGSQSAMNKLFVDMSDADLQKVTAHYASMFITA